MRPFARHPVAFPIGTPDLTGSAPATNRTRSKTSELFDVARPELGAKRVCPTTGRKFYDLNRDPIVSPYTGEALPRSALEPQLKASPRARAPEPEEDEPEVAAAGAEVISLEDVAEGEAESAGAEDETVLAEDASTEDTFLEEEEEGGDVADLIDGEIEDEEEA